MASRINGETGEAIGYYSNGSKSFEQKSSDDLRYEYYQNGQLKMTPHRSNRDAYDIFDEQGRRVLHRHAIGNDDVLNVDLFDEKGQSFIASYQMSNYGMRPTRVDEADLVKENGGKPSGFTEQGTLRRVSMLDDKGMMKSYTFKNSTMITDSEDGHLELDLETLKEEIQEDRQSTQQNTPTTKVNPAVLNRVKNTR